MSRRIFGTIRNKENGAGVAGLGVHVYDADLLSDDVLAHTETDAAGAYAVDIPDRAGLFDKPDVYVKVTTRKGELLRSTRNGVVKNVVADTRIDVDISHFDLYNAGVVADAPPEWKKVTDFVMADPKYRELTLDARADGDPTVRAIREELSSCVSVLDLMKKYTEELHGNANNDSPVFAKMDKLFDHGLPYDEMGGHYYGIGIGLKTVPLQGKLGEHGNILNYIYSTFQGRDSAWIGKTHWEIDSAELDRITGGTVKPDGKVYRGVNHFHELEFDANNPFFFELANFWLHCEDATPYQHEKYHVDKNGAGLIAYATSSIFDANKKVFRLSYRWPYFKNPFPIRWIFDEMVQVAHGVYLGQLLCASRHLFEAYDPALPPEEYGYSNWGYFLLVSDDWGQEARRLFRYLDIAADAVGLVPAASSVDTTSPKFSSLTLETNAAPYWNSACFESVERDLAQQPTVLHLLKRYWEEIARDRKIDTPAFTKLTELFHRGRGADEVSGFLRGVLLGGSSRGFSTIVKENLVEDVWVKSLRTFSPWTGKIFDRITPEKAMELTGGFEKGDVPTFWGSNTLSLRTTREQFGERLLGMLGAHYERVPDAVAMRYGYDATFLHFIARRGKSVDPACPGKDVFQLNYRWPKLRTIIPDRWCIDEMVQIADGLYLAQLLYATDITREYDPTIDPAAYGYGFYGYFLLMDEDWHALRLQIGLDIDNA